jgi:lipopolysaccharide assembly outer membrane protein LptD (OstA)
MKYNRLFLDTKHATLSPDVLTTENATAVIETSNGHSGVSINASKIDINIKNKKGKAKTFTAKIGSVPILYAPSLPLGMWLQLFRLRARVGHSKSLGAFLQSRIGYNIHPGYKLGTSLGIFSKRGLLFGPFVKIDRATESHEIHSLYDFGFISDAHAEKIIKPDKSTKWKRKNRWYLDLQHTQHFGERIDILSSLHWQSDPDFFHDFYDVDAYKHYDIRDQFIEADYRGDSWMMSVIAKPEINSFRKKIQTLPRLHIEKFATEIADSDIFYN